MDRSPYIIGLFITHQADRRLLAAYLSAIGYTVSIADLIVIDPPAWQKFDLVLADEHVGRRYYQHLLTLKTQQDAFFLPIVILLANKTESTPWLTAGFDDILRMPLTKAELGARLAVFLRVRAQSQAAFAATEDRFRALVEYSSDGITLLDAQGRGIYRSPASERLSGYSAEERSGHEVFDLFHPDDLPMARTMFAALLEAPGSSQTLQYRSRHKDGRWRWIEAVVTNLLHEPSVQAIIANFRDITERKQAEQALGQSEARFSTIFRSSPIAISLTRLRDGHFLDINEAYHRLFGYSQSEAIGQSSISLNVYADPDDRVKLIQLLHAQGSIHDYELKMCTKSGEVREVVCSMELITLDDEAYLLASLYDITERKRMEAALSEERGLLARRVDERTADLSAANAKLARAVRLKDEFLAGMSHELRTPLSAILGFSEALREQIYGPLNEQQLQRLGSIEASGRHLLELINDILDLAKISAGMLELMIEPVIVEPICSASIQMITQAAHHKHLAITTRIEPGVVQIQGDARRLKQMLINLLANAVKFTPTGGTIGLEVVGDPTRQIMHFTVWDTGIGIANEHMGKLFQPFVQIDSQLARQYEGTGLGLALVARMAELHGGSVTVTSTVGVGSRFMVTLPWSTHSLSETMPASADQGLGQHAVGQTSARIDAETQPVILLAEDNEATIMLLSDYLTMHGYQMVIARNGNEAIARVYDTHPAIVLMDIQMPSMDGLQAIQHIRAEYNRPDMPIIALTALAMPGDRARCLAAGATDYLTKPVSLHRLAELIETHLHHQGSAQRNHR